MDNSESGFQRIQYFSVKTTQDAMEPAHLSIMELTQVSVFLSHILKLTGTYFCPKQAGVLKMFMRQPVCPEKLEAL